MAAGSRDPSDSAIVRMRFVGTRARYQIRQLARGDVRVAQVEHERRELEEPAVVAHVTEPLEGQEQPTRRRAGEARETTDFGECQLRVLGGKSPEHREPSLQRLDAVVVAFGNRLWVR